MTYVKRSFEFDDLTADEKQKVAFFVKEMEEKFQNHYKPSKETLDMFEKNDKQHKEINERLDKFEKKQELSDKKLDRVMIAIYGDPDTKQKGMHDMVTEISDVFNGANFTKKFIGWGLATCLAAISLVLAAKKLFQ